MSPFYRAVALALLATSAACLPRIAPPMPPVELYRLSGDSALAAPSGGDNGAPLAGNVAVLRYATPGLYAGRGIVYRVDDRYGVYPSREWAIPLGEMLGLLTADALRRVALSRGEAVFDPSTRQEVSYVWVGTVHEFDEIDRGPRVFAGARLDARLVRARDGALVWSGSRRLERAVPDGSMPGIVAALSELATRAVAELTAEAKVAAARWDSASGARRE